MIYRCSAAVLAFMAALVMTIADAGAFDETKYPKFEGQWKRKLGTVNSWDESKRPGLPQDPPLTPEYRKLWEASMADQKEGGQGLDTRVTCISNGMPRMMTILRQLEIFIMPWVTLVVFENNLPRRIYTDGRDWTAKDNPDTLVNEITTVDHALTRPWKVVKNYRREKNVEWHEDLCTENNNHVMIGKEIYFMSADGYLMPAKKDQPPPDLRYFKKAGN